MIRISLSPRQAPYSHLILTSLAFLIFSPLLPKTGHAQAVPPIIPSGLHTQVSDPSVIGSGPNEVTQYNITGGTRVGTNLFHSFGEFNVPRNHIANFLNDSGLETSNILGRVTGGNPSNIFGMIQTTGFENANLFLMNPSGIVFGPTASLNVGGSVTFTTADYLRLAESNGTTGLFHADSALPNMLTSAPVAAFGFLGSNPAAIAVQGSKLEMEPGRSISLVGGNLGFTYIDPDTGFTASTPNGVTINGAKLTAQSGQVNIASVASPGEILAGTLDQAPNINAQSFGALGEISVSQKSLLDVSGKGGGTVLIRGGQFVLSDSTISANIEGPGSIIDEVESIGRGIDITIKQNTTIQNGAVLETNVSGNATPGVTYGGVHVKSDRIEIIGTWSFEDAINRVPPSFFTGIRSNIHAGSTGGNSGAIRLEGNSVLVKDNGQLETIAGQFDGELEIVPRTAGHTGDIWVTANQNLETDFATIRSASSEGSTGNAGNITLTSTNGNINLANASQVTSQASLSRGNTGNISLNASHGDIFLTEGTSVFNQSFLGGALGTIQVIANNLQLSGTSPAGGSRIQGDNFSAMAPGNIILNLSGSLRLADASRIQTVARVQTPAAALTIRAHDMSVTSDSYLSTESIGSGTGGPLNLFTTNLQLRSGGQIRSGSTLGQDPDTGAPVVPSGPGGIVTIQGQTGPADAILIDGPGSGIFTKAEGTGAGGAIDLRARSLTIQNGGELSAETSGTASSAVGGSIKVTATDHVTLTNGASISASSTGPGNAGNIKIDAGRQLSVQGSELTTEARTARGGKIDVLAKDRIHLANGRISTSVLDGTGDSGTIFIDPNEVIVQNNSTILTHAVRGRGGDITILTPRFLQDQTSLVDASSQFGPSGKVTIQSSTSNLSGTVTQLSSKTDQTQPLLQNRCVALAGGEQSTFIVAGRDSLPAEPGGWLSSPVSMEHWTGGDTEEHASGLMVRRKGSNGLPAMAAHKGETKILSLRRLTPPGFLVRTFATGSTGCPS